MVAVGDKDSHSLNSLEALCTDSNITAACTVSNRNDHPCTHNRQCTQDHNSLSMVVECMANHRNNANSSMVVAECMAAVVCMANHHNNSTAAVVCTVVVWAVVCMVSHKCNNRSMAVECMANHNSLNLAVDLAACTASNHNVNNSHNMVAAGCMAVAWAAVCTVSRKCNSRSMAVVDSVAAWVAECMDSHNNANSSHNMVAVCTVAVLINNSRNSNNNLTILTLNQ